MARFRLTPPLLLLAACAATPHGTADTAETGTGELWANWVAIGTVPLDEWLTFSIEGGVGGTGAWSLTVTQEDGTTQAWTGLSGGVLSELNWVGFVANADATARFWVDDIDVR